MAEPWWVSLRRHITLISIVVLLQLLLAAAVARAQSNLEVTITGDRALTPSASSRDDTVASSVVRRDRLAAPGVEAADVLRDLPGVQVRQTGGLAAPSTLGLRGANPNQTAAVIAGARMDDELTGVTDLSLFPLWFTNRIEIFRGASPFGFDRILPGGVLLVEPRSDTQSGGLVRLEAGSFGERAAHVIASSGDESFSVTAGLRAAASDNDYPFSNPFRNNQGQNTSGNQSQTDRIQNADFSSRDVWLTASRCTSRYTIEAVANRFEREQGVLKIAVVPSKQARAESARDLWATRVIVSLDSAHELEARFNILASSILVRDPLGELALQAHQRVDVDTIRSESGLALQSKPTANGRWRLSLGVEEARLTRVDAPGESFAPPDVVATREAVRGAAAAEARLVGPLGVHAQAMGEVNSERANSSSERHNLTEETGRAGLHWRQTSWQSWFNLTRAARPPALGERYGLSVSVFGNPRLRPERSLGAELGARFAPHGYSSPVWLEAVSFARYTNDAIVIVPTTQGHATPVNLDTTHVLGLEFAGGARVFKPFEIEANLTLLDPRETSQLFFAGQAQLIPLQSTATASTVLRMRQPIERENLRTLLVEARLLWESLRASGVANLPAQSSFDLDFALLGLLKYTDLRMRIANLFGVPRYDFVGYPLPGRSVHSSLEVKW